MPSHCTEACQVGLNQSEQGCFVGIILPDCNTDSIKCQGGNKEWPSLDCCTNAGSFFNTKETCTEETRNDGWTEFGLTIFRKYPSEDQKFLQEKTLLRNQLPLLELLFGLQGLTAILNASKALFAEASPEMRGSRLAASASAFFGFALAAFLHEQIACHAYCQSIYHG